uniref:TD and POZ domain-containing protein 2 n=2 Tax=Cajanus cajan TaxID=3821 RepID=A0A151TSF1_CAJCA|nr:TD and POZ domain-containing protein 2 [Cajanus cajan]
MGDRVETLARLAQWRIENFGPSSYKKSDSFKVGIWNWYFSIVRNKYLYIHLFPEPSSVSKDYPPFARFILRVSSAGSSRTFHISPVQEKLLRTHDDFVWSVDTTFVGRFIIDVEFLDLKICPPNGGETSSVWPSEGNSHSIAFQNGTLRILSRMIEEAIHADLTIITADGTLRAHKAVLSASSPVFQSMFHHNLKEKESSTIHIQDMSLESCTALLSYIYGTIKQEDFWKHRLALLGAANKYDLGGLKDICEESLMEDLHSGNVLEMLNEAWFYQLLKLKKGCLEFLFKFGKVHDIREDEMNNFFQHADRELMLEMFQEMLSISISL